MLNNTNKLVSSFIFIYFMFLTSLGANEKNNKDLAIHHFMQGEFLLNQGNYALAVLEFRMH